MAKGTALGFALGPALGQGVAIQPRTWRWAGYSLCVRWWAVVVTLLFCAATVLLGHWQGGRAEQKRALAERAEAGERASPVAIGVAPVDPQSLLLRRVSARGEYVAAHTVLLDNKIHRGRAGYHVLTPLRIEGSNMHVLVNRGWVAGGARREDVPQVATSPGTVTVEGVALARVERAFDAGGGVPSGRVWQNLAFADYQSWSGLQVQPLVIEQRSADADGLVRDWPRADYGVDKHRSYSMQWYLMAIFSVVLFIVLSVRRDRPSAD